MALTLNKTKALKKALERNSVKTETIEGVEYIILQPPKPINNSFPPMTATEIIQNKARANEQAIKGSHKEIYGQWPVTTKDGPKEPLTVNKLIKVRDAMRAKAAKTTIIDGKEYYTLQRPKQCQ